MKQFLFALLLTIMQFSSHVLAQGTISVEEYIQTYKSLAIEEMQKHRIPASITLAQGILESGCGNGDLARLANNHFGIKCHDGWTGRTFHQDDDEKGECFRKYKSAKESYQDHSLFLTSRDRYVFLFDLDISDYKSWAYGLKKAGYATNPRYPEMLIRIIEENGLAELDSVGSWQLAVGSRKKEHRNPEPGIRNPESFAAPTVFEIAGRGGNDRVIFLNNGTKFILAREGDDCFKIAGEFGIYSWQIREYNELGKKDNLVSGEKVYLEKKPSKSSYPLHIAAEGESLRDLSQDYGVRLKALCRRNGLQPDERLAAGQEIRLK